MPTYVYKREDGTTFEIMQRITDEPLTVDPATGQKVTRVIGGGAGLIFKGHGFYLTDYARKNSSEAGVSSNGSETESKSDAPSTKKEKAASSKKDI